MMFVFHVDQGRMLTFKMECMIEDIRKLKELIERNHAIPAKSIVLLVSGGELLEDDSRACNYATGTDTNPIYMFCKSVGESPLLSPGPIKETEVDLEGMVRKHLELPVSYQTVVARAQLAQKIYDMGKEELRRCESLIFDQHLQQQGWSAVVANLEDTIKVFQERYEYFNRYYEQQLRLHEEQMEILQNFDKCLQQLAEIPILSSLMENAESRPYGMFDEVFNPNVLTNNSTSRTASNNEPPAIKSGSGTEGDQVEATNAAIGDHAANSSENQQHDTSATGGETAGTTDEVALTESERAKGISLLDWISAMEGQLTLKRMAEECRINIEKFSRPQLTALHDRIDRAITASQSLEVKVVKGLEERLAGLDKLLADAKKLLRDQNELAQSIQMNQDRANKIGDMSILPDLCAMHQNTLRLMQTNHVKLLEYRRRCTVAKEELGQNLTKRLKYITNMETRVHELDSFLSLYNTSLQRLQKHLSIIEQIQMVPRIYVSAVTEVVRRRMFSSAFLRWASDLACRLMAIHNEEVVRRQEFAALFEGHFLSTLFPGMSDMPPSYAIQAPSVFDSSLPALDKQDLQELSRYLPELTEQITLPNLASVIDFFQTRSVEQQQLLQQDDGNGCTEQDDVSVSVRSKDNTTASSGDHAQADRKDSDRIGGADSETDTEEYEKVTGEGQNQSSGERSGERSRQEEETQKIKEPIVVTCSVATSTDPVETVCAETLTEVRFHDILLPNPSVRTSLTGTNTATTTNTASCMATNTLTTSTITASANTNVAIMSAHAESDGRQSVQSVDPGTEQQVAPSGYPSAIPEERAAHGGVGVTTANLDGRCPLYTPSSFEGGARRLRRGIFTRTSSSERSSSSQELLLLALMEGTAAGATGNVLIRSPGEEGEFINSEFYIDESLPSSAASVERRQQLEHQHQQEQLCHSHDNRHSFADCLLGRGRSSYEEGTVLLLLQDNLGTTRLEVERLKGLLSSVYQLSQDSIMMLRDQLARVRAEADTNRTQFQSELVAMNRAWNDIQQLVRDRERETIQQLTVDHELEMNDLRKSIHQKDDEIQSLRSDNSTMKASQIEAVSSYEQEKKALNEQIAQMREVIERLETQLACAEVDRKKAIQEAIEQLEHKHRTEIETLRCRFKLMATSMDRSPSDTSLEKIEKPDMIDIGTHEQLLAQMRDDFQREKERAVRVAIEEERQRWEANAIGGGMAVAGSAGSGSRLHRSYGTAGSPSGGSQDVYKRILDEKDRQLEELREKESQLGRECMRMRETIQSLTDPELSPLNDPSCREQLEALETDRQQMAERLVKLHGKVDALEHEKHALSRELERQRRRAAQLTSCSEGDTVMFVWNSTYQNYTIAQVAEFIYFVHESCHPDMGLLPLVKGEVPAILSGYGTVVQKEFCHARRNDNRYGVSRGTQFYRVRLTPIYLTKKSKGRGFWSTGGSGSSRDGSTTSSQQHAPTAVVTIEMQSSGTSTAIGASSTGRLIDSFAQTEQPTSSSTTAGAATTVIQITGDGSKSPTAASRDMIDSGVVEQQRSSYRERNISITDEDDVVVAGRGSTGSIDRIRYQSVCEEEDPAAGGDDTDGGLPESTGGSSSATDHLSCYTSATDTSIVAIRSSTLLIGGTRLDGSASSSSSVTAPLPPAPSTIAADIGNNSDETSTASSTHLLSATNHSQPMQSLLSTGSAGVGFASIADDISDSADSEYRSLDGNEQEDSDNAPVSIPGTAEERSVL
uniref:RB1-inducible coiled-coil protein 1 n=1 Tax=Anopheles farauti TaxID=69004 RepID=A0A182Q3V8_9DIPT